MKQWAAIRRRVLVDGVSKRQIIRETGMHWQTLEKILEHSHPPGYRRSQPYQSILDPHVDWIKRVLDDDKSQPTKQRHTAKRIFDRLVKERGFAGGYTTVKDFIRHYRRISREVFMPLDHPPGEAQVDYFEALANIDGTLQKVHCFLMSLPHSGMCFVRAYPRECTESFWDGHAWAFEFFGGVPYRIIYDNSRIAVKQITGCHRRVLTDGFLQLQSHFLFTSHFCTVRRANEKGVVEHDVRYARCNFMVPVPQVKSFAHLNTILWEACYNEQYSKVRGKGKTKHQLWQDDQQAFLDKPTVPFDACKTTTVTANSLSLIRFDGNDYSVPTRYGHHDLTVKAFVDTIEITTRRGDEVARHDRLWVKDQVRYNPVHYLRLLAFKPGALDYARPLRELKLPVEFDVLRKKLESQLPDQHEGTRQYIRVLVLLDNYPLSRLHQAVSRALRLPCPNADIVKQYCMDHEHPMAKTFDLAGRRHLEAVQVDAPRLEDYDHLKGEAV